MLHRASAPPPPPNLIVLDIRDHRPLGASRKRNRGTTRRQPRLAPTTTIAALSPRSRRRHGESRYPRVWAVSGVGEEAAGRPLLEVVRADGRPGSFFVDAGRYAGGEGVVGVVVVVGGDAAVAGGGVGVGEVGGHALAHHHGDADAAAGVGAGVAECRAASGDAVDGLPAEAEGRDFGRDVGAGLRLAEAGAVAVVGVRALALRQVRRAAGLHVHEVGGAVAGEVFAPAGLGTWFRPGGRGPAFGHRGKPGCLRGGGIWPARVAALVQRRGAVAAPVFVEVRPVVAFAYVAGHDGQGAAG